MSSMLYFLYFQASDKLDSEVLEFWLFIELSILEWFSTWFSKHARVLFRVQSLSDSVHGPFLQYDF